MAKPWEEYQSNDVKPWEEYQAKPAQTTQSAPKEQSFAERAGHQLGLTARDIIEGGAGTIGLLSDPVALIANKTLGTDFLPASTVGQHAADAMGLPTPQNGLERGVNDTAKMLVGTGGMIKGAAGLANNVASPVIKSALTSLASNPSLQASSTIGAGAAGSIAKENGASPLGQFGASLAGGIAAPLGVSFLNKTVVSPASNFIKNFVDTKNIEKQSTEAIKNAGVNLGELPFQAQQSIISDVKNAVKTGQNLSPDAIRRLADYKTVGATPMGSSLTLNPADITRDRNLAKLSANSRDPAAQSLSNLQRNNDVKLIQGLNDLGAETHDTATAGNQLIEALNIKDQKAKAVIDSFYKQARETSGRSAQLDPSHFTQIANNMLDESLLGGKLPSDVRNVMNSIAQGKTPLTVDVAEQYKTAIGNLQRASSDPAERLALGKVREALDNTPLLDGQGKEAIDAFNKARSANRQYMQMVEQNPALQAVRDGVEPDKFVKTFIIGNGAKSNISDVAALKDSLKDNPVAIKTIRDQIVAHLKDQAVSGKADEVANFSPSNFNKALKNIGDQKLSMFFEPKDIEMLKTIGRVGSYEKFQPTGSAVNNSNTAAGAISAMLDFIANTPVLRKIPLANKISDSAREASTAIKADNTMNPSKALTLPAPKKDTKTVPIGSLLYPSSGN